MSTLLKRTRLFAARPAVEAGRRLYLAAVAQARTPALYLRLGAPDTADGRFELYALHVVLLLHRLKDQGVTAGETGQALFDAFVGSLDDALREAGVGDLSVGKKMRKLGEAFYGRVRAYDEALAALPDRAALEGVIARVLFAGAASEGAARLAAYASAAAERLAAEPLATLLDGGAVWPEIAA